MTELNTINVENFAERLKSSLPKGMTQGEFAEKIDHPINTVSRWFRGMNLPKADALVQISRIADIDVDWLLTGEHSTSRSSDLVFVKRYDVTASAGAGSVVELEKELEPIAFSEQWLRSVIGVGPEHLSMIRMAGDSMYPTLKPEGVLIINHTVESFTNDNIYAFQEDGDLYVKRIQKVIGGGLIIRSDNTAYHEQKIEASDTLNLTIIGQVVWAGGWV